MAGSSTPTANRAAEKALWRKSHNRLVRLGGKGKSICNQQGALARPAPFQLDARTVPNSGWAMCGIFGVLLRADARISHADVTAMLRELYLLSESRGKESAGLHAYFPVEGEAWTLKGAQRASDLLQSSEYRKLTDGTLRRAFNGSGNGPTVPVALLAHSRLVTNGVAEMQCNNQPVRWGPVTMIHNGIVVNVDELWKAHPHLKRTAEVDTEVMAASAADAVSQGADPARATAHVFGEIRGAASVAWLHEQANWVVLATNTGDLFHCTLPGAGVSFFASERYILETALKRMNGAVEPGVGINWLPPGNGTVISLDTLQPQQFPLRGETPAVEATDGLQARKAVQHDVMAAAPAPIVAPGMADEKLLRYNEARMRDMRRCSRCVLPETFPFIDFDDKGVCNYCRGYKRRYGAMDPTSKQKFIDSLQGYRRNDGSPDVLVAFSGGRDSSYGLHLIKKEFGLTPITFTYDWGMVTDLARRNIARICGELGIQNVLVSADIRGKRDNIRANVSAWLRKPDLGMVPLFMAGDKYFFKVSNQLKRQTGIRLDLWCANPLENTDFKAGFCGVPPDFDKKRVDYLSLGRQARMIAHYGWQFLRNPAYLNRSIPDTLTAFLSYYVEPRRDFFFIFDHFIWNEDEVDQALRHYDWELSPDSRSTWRIGDGTAPFYNYIYVTARGFSEFDTFRSNQVREGMLSRDHALALVLDNNRPRAASLRWYLDTIRLDFDNTVRRINELDTLGLHH
jgi:hypothetical protein